MKRTTRGMPDDLAEGISSASADSEPSMREPGDPTALPRPRRAPVARLDAGRAVRVDHGGPGDTRPTGEVVGLTRAGAAALLHVSSSTVRRLEGRGVLHPRIVDGVHFFDPEEIHRARVARACSTPSDGDAAALAFELLDKGVGLRDIVKRCRVTPERARALAAEWKKMGSGELVISAEVRAEISRVVGLRLQSSDALLPTTTKIAISVQLQQGLQPDRSAAKQLIGLDPRALVLRTP